VILSGFTAKRVWNKINRQENKPAPEWEQAYDSGFGFILLSIEAAAFGENQTPKPHPRVPGYAFQQTGFGN